MIACLRRLDRCGGVPLHDLERQTSPAHVDAVKPPHHFLRQLVDESLSLIGGLKAYTVLTQRIELSKTRERKVPLH